MIVPLESEFWPRRVAELEAKLEHFAAQAAASHDQIERLTRTAARERLEARIQAEIAAKATRECDEARAELEDLRIALLGRVNEAAYVLGNVLKDIEEGTHGN